MTAPAAIGDSLRRVEDERFLTGNGRFVDDVTMPGVAHAFVLRSPHAHARIRRIDIAPAQAAPGVLAVFTGHDVAREKLGGIACHLHHAPQSRDRLPSLLARLEATRRERRVRADHGVDAHLRG